MWILTFAADRSFAVSKRVAVAVGTYVQSSLDRFMTLPRATPVGGRWDDSSPLYALAFQALAVDLSVAYVPFSWGAGLMKGSTIRETVT
jgi:hypothetical protein